MQVDRSFMYSSSWTFKRRGFAWIEEGKWVSGFHQVLVPRGNPTAIPFLHSKPSDVETSKLVGIPHSGNHCSNLLICG